MQAITFKELVDALSTLQGTNNSAERGKVETLVLEKMEELLKQGKHTPSCE